MEGSWQAKRVSPRPPATPIHQFPTLQSRNQIHEGVVGQHMHPYPTQHVHANDGALREGSVMFETLNLGHPVFDFKSAKTVAANNFQSLVSASPQQQCEVAAYPLSSMTSVATFPLPNLESSVPAKDYSALVQGPSLMSWFVQPHGSGRIKIDETPCPVVSVKDLPPTACATVSLPHDVSQTRSSFFGGLDLSRSASYHATTKNGMGSKGSDIHCPSTETMAHNIFHHAKGAFSQQSSKASADFDGVSPVSTHATMRGCPQVFCLNTSGVLLLSDTGHLGVVCSCHNLHMSVENFSQHSGSCGVDPGDAIRLENGVSLRQWRKHSFPKLGIKVLDDNGGWDWPDWNIINRGSLGAMPSYIQNITKISHLTKDVNAFSRTRNSNQPCSDLTVPASFLVQRSKNPTDCLGQDALEKYSYGGRDMMKNLFGSAHGPTTIFPDGQNILASEGTQSEISRKSYPDDAGKNVYRHLTEYLDILSKCGNPRAGPNQIAENSMPSNSDFTGNRTPPQLFISGASPPPSHVELKLGQSSELSRPCVSSVYFKSQPMDGLTTKKFVPCDQPQQQGLDHFLLSSQPGSSTNKLAEKERNIYHKRHEVGNINGNNNQMNDQVGRSSPLMTMLCSPIVHPDSNDGGRLSGDTSKLVSSTEQLMSGLLGADSQVDICELDDCGKWKIVYPDQSDLAVVSKDSLIGTDISSSGLFNSSSLPTPFRVARSPALPDRSCAPIDSDFHMQHITDVSNPTPDAKTSVPVGFRSFAGGDDRSATPAAFRLSPLPASTQSIRNTSLPTLKSTLQGENAIHSCQINFDENPRLLALKDMVMHNGEGPNIELYRDNGQLYGCSPMRLQSNEREETMMRPKLDKGTVLVGNQDISKVYIHSHSCRSYCSGVGCSKPCCLAGAKNTWNLCMPQEITVKDASSRSCCFNHGPFDQPLLRLGRAMHDFRRVSDQHLHCHQRESNSCYSGNLRCFGQLRCLAGNCCSRLGDLYEHTDHASSSSCVHGSVLDRGSYSPNTVINQHIHHQSLVGQLPGKSKLDSLGTSLKIPGEVINAGQEVECVLHNTSMNNPGRAPAGSSLNEQKMSNMCSEESAPSITECSVSSDNLCTSDVLNAGVKFGSIIDEESRVKRSISSCDAIDSERPVDTTLFARKIDSTSWISSKAPGGKSDNVCVGDRLRNSTKLITEKKKNSLVSNPSGSDTRPTPVSNDLKTENKGSVFKWKKLSSARHLEDSPVVTCASEKYKSPCHHIQDSLPLHKQEITSRRSTGSGQTTFKRKRSVLPSSGIFNKKMLVHVVDHVDGGQLVGQQKAKRTADTPKIGASKVLSRKKTIFNLKRVVDCSLPMDGVSEGKVHRKRNCNLIGHASVSQEIDPINHESKHTVSGNCRIITNGKLSDGFPKPLKFGSLSLILKTAKECTITEAESTNFSLVPKNRMEYGDENSRCSLKGSTCKNEDTEVPPCSFVIGEDHFISMDQVTNEFNARKVRKLSLCELSEKLKASHGRHEEVSAELDYRKKSDMEKAACQVVIALDKIRSSTGKSNCSADIYDKKNTKWTYHSALKYSARLHTGNERERPYVIEHFQKHPTRTSKRIKRKKSVLDTEASCSVCRNKDSDAGNVLLECAGCLIKVHQACYGVLKLPKGRWCCRPCRTDSNEIACVLCGYQGGAMTRALRSQRVVKSLLRAWNVLESPMNKVCVSQTKDGEFSKHNSASVNECLGKEGSSMEFMKTCSQAVNTGKKSSCDRRDSNIGISNGMRSDVVITNTITDTLLNPNTKQWVHMVCGLWMPGTRCPNVDTMSAFDVSGVPCLKKKKVCSLCRRPGGSCIKCRVVDCRVTFHPWCAHQKGLLQNETEGDNNQNIGFYGRCLLHSRNDICDAAPTDPLETETSIQNKDHPKDDDLTCARTEGYKGRKQEAGFQHSNVHLFSSERGGCMVPQEQINAWLHINGLKSCVGKPFLASDVEHDSRKEYVRYKQAKGWKNLVVYKSGIHALGLYTSQFIPRGAMVVEYVGEIVGSRVADKREAKYLSGKGVQYKSACYFFRIDREQIIDATQKGGIARFVNHSCQPNCVAKIISIRNEKKVVFFAERAINPGEEITYDYHFNHEDEGKKIPCFCNSKYCRRYLN